MPEIGSYDIRVDQLTRDRSVPRTRSYENQSENDRVKTRMIQMFREFERLANNPEGISAVQI